MTLRDVGAWVEQLWGSFVDGLHIAASQNFLDWPLWLSIPVAIGVPILLIWALAEMLKEARTGKPDPMGRILAYGAAAFLCALATYDLWVSMTVLDEDRAGAILGPLRIIYPMMTIFFGAAVPICIAKRRRHRRERLDEN